jgi:hypothetical protein
MLRMQKMHTAPVYLPIPFSYRLETFQGVPLDSLGVGAWEIRRIIAPDHRQRCQEVPKRILAMPAVLFHFSIGSLQCGGGRGLAWPLDWPLGCVVDVEGGIACFVVRVHENKKNPVNVNLQGSWLFPSLHAFV